MAGNFNYLTEAQENELKTVARAIITPGKGIFATDENKGNIKTTLL